MEMQTPSLIPSNFRSVVAENPYDDMGSDFATTFGSYLDNTNLEPNSCLGPISFHLFKLRLGLAQKYKTFFAKQVTDGGELWRDRFTGKGNNPCYSFALPQLARTAKFFGVCQRYEKETPWHSIRRWSLNYAALPDIPFGPHQIIDGMPVYEHRYVPQWEARDGGPFFFRWMKYSDRVYLFEHPRSRWVHMLKNEATTWWNRARDTKLSDVDRFSALASFEWLWYITNPFMRAGATTGDCLSFLVQKEMVKQGMRVFICQYFYAQDCEALILPFDKYVAKRVNDLRFGYVMTFPELA